MLVQSRDGKLWEPVAAPVSSNQEKDIKQISAPVRLPVGAFWPGALGAGRYWQTFSISREHGVILLLLELPSRLEIVQIFERVVACELGALGHQVFYR